MFLRRFFTDCLNEDLDGKYYAMMLFVVEWMGPFPSHWLRLTPSWNAGAAARNELGGEGKREEEKNKWLGVASASIGFNAVLLMSVTRPVSFLRSVPVYQCRRLTVVKLCKIKLQATVVRGWSFLFCSLPTGRRNIVTVLDHSTLILHSRLLDRLFELNTWDFKSNCKLVII